MYFLTFERDICFTYIIIKLTALTISRLSNSTLWISNVILLPDLLNTESKYTHDQWIIVKYML